MKTRSHLFALAASMIARKGESLLVCTMAQGTFAASANCFTLLRVLSARFLICFVNSGSDTKLGGKYSPEISGRNSGVAWNAVMRAPFARAKRTAAFAARNDSGDPSVGTRM